MAVSNIKATFQCDVKKAWSTVTSLYNYQWRSDLIRIEVLDEKSFVEYTREGYPTTFTVTCEIPCERWEFDMENSNMKGHWTGLFKESNNSFYGRYSAEKNHHEAICKRIFKETARALCFGLKKRIRRIKMEKRLTIHSAHIIM